jgi:hypothetical protein
MDEDKKKQIRNIIILGVSAIIIVSIGISLFTGNDDEKEEQIITNMTEVTETKNGLKQVNNNDDTKTVVQIEPTNVGEYKRIARNFVERFGSYSNHSNFQNIVDLYPLMTTKLQNWAKDFVSKNKKKIIDINNYHSCVTKVISEEVISETENRIKLKFITQRIESKNGEQNTYYQDIKVTMKLNNGQWEIDRATWQEKR